MLYDASSRRSNAQDNSGPVQHQAPSHCYAIHCFPPNTELPSRQPQAKIVSSELLTPWSLQHAAKAHGSCQANQLSMFAFSLVRYARMCGCPMGGVSAARLSGLTQHPIGRHLLRGVFAGYVPSQSRFGIRFHALIPGVCVCKTCFSRFFQGTTDTETLTLHTHTSVTLRRMVTNPTSWKRLQGGRPESLA